MFELNAEVCKVDRTNLKRYQCATEYYDPLDRLSVYNLIIVNITFFCLLDLQGAGTLSRKMSGIVRLDCIEEP